ncbi:MAG TPA: hypothetical protein VGS07_20495 [Thermoanaerobaculia bacterium]|jgi:hypothetical protein|nr:hypothetical protein [Thermoanaerobaculia bacterium]
MSITIELMLAGLIALVPNRSQNPTKITAHLVKGGDHKPILEVIGKSKLKSTGGICAVATGIITCPLEGVTIDIKGMDSATLELPALERPLGRMRPDPSRFNDFRSLDWLVRMSDIESGTGVPDSAKIQANTWTRVDLFSNAALIGELDGSEAGSEAVIGFRKGNSSSILRQTVGESLVFALSVDRKSFGIILKKDGLRDEIIADEDCKSNRCLGIFLKNETSKSDCAYGDGDHFDHYYDLVQDAGDRRLPFSIDPNRPCIKDKENASVWSFFGIFFGFFDRLLPTR